MPFKTMGLADPLVQGILATGYTAPTEIQSQAIPAIIDGKDIIGCAQTGTGKTAAFVLPMLHRIETEPRKSKRPVPRALVLTPTRELAVQIEEAIRGYGRFMKLKTIAVYGGARMGTQIKFLKWGVDVVVATPGRLLDHLNRGTINLSTVDMLILDEADRMFDMGFVEDIRKIVGQVAQKRQTLLFSATMPNSIQKLAESIQRSPVKIQIGPQHNPIDTITQHILPVPQEQKMDLLLHLLERESMDSVLVFSRTKRGADKICRKLNHNFVDAVAIHSDRTQRQRLKALEGFKAGKFQVMVATDIAARGINVEGISHVVNYDVPGYAEDYVHRIGRTGRATATGDAITFVCQDEVVNLRKIEKFIECTFKPVMIEGFAYSGRVNFNEPSKGKQSGRKRVGSSQRRRKKAQSEQQQATGRTTPKKSAKPTPKNASKDGKKPSKKGFFKKAKNAAGKAGKNKTEKGRWKAGKKNTKRPG